MYKELFAFFRVVFFIISVIVEVALAINPPGSRYVTWTKLSQEVNCRHVKFAFYQKIIGDFSGTIL